MKQQISYSYTLKMKLFGYERIFVQYSHKVWGIHRTSETYQTVFK
jgi:hypothetical protein